MNCPDCNHIQTCPCAACQSRNPTEKPWIHDDSDCMACGNCGVFRDCMEWMEIEQASYKKTSDGI